MLCCGTKQSAFKAAKGQTALSLDPSCRPKLTHDTSAYTARMAEFARTADIVCVSDTDFDFLFGGDDFDAAPQEVLDGGAALFIVTLGGDGVVA